MKVRKSAPSRTGESGFSLLELLVSMTIFLIISASIWGLMRAAQISKKTVNEEVQLAKGVRIGLNLIARDAYNAGFGYPLNSTVVSPDNRVSTALGIPNDSDSSRDTVPPVISGNNVTLNTFNTTPNIRTDQVTFLFKDETFNNASGFSRPLSIGSRSTTSGGVVELTSTEGNAACRINDLFILVGQTGNTLGVATGLSGTNRIQFANGDPIAFNQTALLGVLNNISATNIYRVRMVTYLVTADGTLTRREYVNVLPTAAFVDEPLVYNVENFQLQYVMDDGTLSDNPSAGPDGVAGTGDDTQANLDAVRQIRLTISVRSTEKDQNNQYYRETMTTTVSTRNLGYEAS